MSVCTAQKESQSILCCIAAAFDWETPGMFVCVVCVFVSSIGHRLAQCEEFVSLFRLYLVISVSV